ncbi:threonine synthase [Devriesea agamarum]|uniref:threonine synthase n=1 Tax=Devriesea agamarum TaxID=472569 RepID=UPI00071E14F9|nr:threonine synthase [Devriesea agamarum]
MGAQLWRGVIAEHRERLPLTAEDPELTLGEGGTPLIPVPALSRQVSGDVYVKVEGMNPTGSFKDRGMVVAMAKAAGRGARSVIAASTGNTSASAAAYASRLGMDCTVLLPQGKIAAGKLAQAIVHGARLIAVDGNFDDCLTIARTLHERFPVELVNSVNPFRLQGQKTAAFEVCNALGYAPDLHILPVGNAGNISAYWLGYTEYYQDKVISARPRMWGFQAAGAAPFVLGGPVAHPETVATAIRIGAPASWDLALAARDESGGKIEAVTDEQILAAQAMLADQAGVFVEPASAAGIAGLVQNARRGEVEAGQTIVVTVTGNGLKDVDTALSTRDLRPVEIPATADAAAQAMNL